MCVCVGCRESHCTDYLTLPLSLRGGAVAANLLFPFSFSLPLSIDQQIPAPLARPRVHSARFRLSSDVPTTYTLLGKCRMILTRPKGANSTSCVLQ